MASPCEVRVDSSSPALTAQLGGIAEEEARRIELKYSRYRDDSVITRINRSEGRPLVMDNETAALLDYADSCYRLSKGLFDVTSGVLRRVWRFDGSDNIPGKRQVADILPYIGWSKVTIFDAPAPEGPSKITPSPTSAAILIMVERSAAM